MTLMEALDCLDSAVRRINRLMEFISDYDEGALTEEELHDIQDTVTSIQWDVEDMAYDLENTLRAGDGKY